MKTIPIILSIILLVLTFVLADLKQPSLKGYVKSKSWEKEYHIKKGETLWSIAEDIRTNQEDLRLIILAIKEVNEIDSFIKENQKIVLPNN